jgi:hypothetical protein
VQLGADVVPPPTALFVGIVLIGAFDVFAAFAAMTVFSICALIRASSPDLSDVRLLMVLVMISFGPSMLAGAFRNFRRPAANAPYQWYERIIDIAVGGFIAGWATQNLINVLTPISGTALTLTAHASQIGAMVAIAVTLRVVAEEVTARYFPARLRAINVIDASPAGTLQVNISLALRALFFAFLMGAIFPHSLLLYVGTILFILPAFLDPLAEKLPNLPKLHHMLPRGLPGLAIGMLFAQTVGSVVAAHFAHSSDVGAFKFVGATAASACIALLGMLGRKPVEGDVYWYMRPQNKWIYRIGGVGVFVFTLYSTGIL